MNRPSLLCVEHGSHHLQQVTSLLEAAGFAVRVAGSNTALELFLSATFDAVVLEHQPPIIDATVLVAAFREHRADIPVVLLAAEARSCVEDTENGLAVCPRNAGVGGLLKVLYNLLAAQRTGLQQMRNSLQQGRELRAEQRRLRDEQHRWVKRLLASAGRAAELMRCRRILSVCYLPGLFGLRRRALQVGGYEVIAAVSRLVAEGLLHHQTFEIVVIGQAVPLQDKYLLVAAAAERNIPAILLYRDEPDNIPAAAAQLRGPEDPCAILATVESLLQMR